MTRGIYLPDGQFKPVGGQFPEKAKAAALAFEKIAMSMPDQMVNDGVAAQHFAIKQFAENATPHQRLAIMTVLAANVIADLMVEINDGDATLGAKIFFSELLNASLRAKIAHKQINEQVKKDGGAGHA